MADKTASMFSDQLRRMIDALYDPLDRDEVASLLITLKRKADNNNASLSNYIEAMLNVLDDSAVGRRLDEMRRLDEKIVRGGRGIASALFQTYV